MEKVQASFCRSCGFIAHKYHAFNYCPCCSAKLFSAIIDEIKFYEDSKQWWESHPNFTYITAKYDPWIGGVWKDENLKG